MTSANPAVPAGVVQVISVAEMTTREVQFCPPTVTRETEVVLFAMKLVPEMVTGVPPAVEPLSGLTVVMVGGGK